MTNETNPGPDRPVGEVRGARFPRRRFLQTAGVAAGAVALGLDPAEAVAAGGQQNRTSEENAPPNGYSGTMADLKHVVILMQENRSFDHYLGQLPGARGQNDKQVLKFQDGTTVFQQRDADGNIVTPFASTSHVSTKHNFYGANEGRWNTWIVDKGTIETMRYFLPETMPWMYSVAAQYTVCDMSFCSMHGPTIPNRYYFMTGTANGEITNAGQNDYSRTWLTVPEQLQSAGISWRVFSDNSGNGVKGSLQRGFIGEYGCNVTNSFRAFDPRTASDSDLAEGTGKIWKANSFLYADTGVVNDDSEENLNGVLRDFIAACQPDAEHPLPEVSWIVMPAEWSEHPAFDTVHGERYMNKILQTLQSNLDIWNHTLVIVTYDENDGLFDHVLPPRPEPGTPGEFAGETPFGFGPRIPMLLISPWTRGGYVASEVFDHTSTVKFLETWSKHLGKPFTSPNITPWRRSIAGDLTSAIDFAHPRPGRANIADPVTGTPPHVSDQRLKHRDLSFHANATLTEDRSAGTVTALMTLAGGPHGKAVSLQVFPDAHQEFSNTPYTVSASDPRRYTWDAQQTEGKYAFSVYGPDGFLRSFAGQVVPAAQQNIGIPRVDVDLVSGSDGKVRLTLHNDGTEAVQYSLKSNDYLGGSQTRSVAAGKSTVVTWPTDEGYYDVIITADTGTGWTQRYAGRVATV